MRCANKRIPQPGHNVFDYLHISQDDIVINVRKPSFPGIYRKLPACDGTTTPRTQPRKNVTTMGKVDTSDLMMVTPWVKNIIEYLIMCHLQLPNVMLLLSYIFNDFVGIPVSWLNIVYKRFMIWKISPKCMHDCVDHSFVMVSLLVEVDLGDICPHIFSWFCY